MNTPRRRIGTALSVLAVVSAWVVGLGWAAGMAWAAPRGMPTHARAVEDATGAPRSQTPGRTPRPAGEGTGSESQARRIARERYQFLKRLEPRLGLDDLPIYSMTGDYYNVTVFPVGRADRAYIVLDGDSYQGGRGVAVFCFQRKGGQVELVYRITLDTADRPAKKVKRIRSLLDYIHASGDADGSLVIEGRISRFARNDLAAQREYALYCCQIMSDEDGPLDVGLLSDVEVGSVLPDPSQEAHYALDRDPVTHAVLDEVPDEFFERYGLPVSKKEMALIRAARY